MSQRNIQTISCFLCTIYATYICILYTIYHIYYTSLYRYLSRNVFRSFCIKSLYYVIRSYVIHTFSRWIGQILPRNLAIWYWQQASTVFWITAEIFLTGTDSTDILYIERQIWFLNFWYQNNFFKEFTSGSVFLQNPFYCRVLKLYL